MAIRIKSTVRNAMLSAINDAANAGSGAAVIEVRTGTQPANADASASGTLLATITCADPAFETPVAGVMDIDAAPDLTGTASASGTAGHCRMKDSAGAVVFDGSCTEAGGGGDFIITEADVVNGQPVTLTLGALTQPVG